MILTNAPWFSLDSGTIQIIYLLIPSFTYLLKQNITYVLKADK